MSWLLAPLWLVVRWLFGAFLFAFIAGAYWGASRMNLGTTKKDLQTKASADGAPAATSAPASAGPETADARASSAGGGDPS